MPGRRPRVSFQACHCVYNVLADMSLRDSIPSFNAFTLILRRVKIAGSPIGSPDEIRDMLDLYAKAKMKGWIQTQSMTDANKAVLDMGAGKARYRYVLVNEKHGGKL